MKSRNISLDLFKIILAVFVVLIHCFFLKDISLDVYYLTTNGLFRTAVPVFFIINGYFFTQVIEKKTIVKWMKRVFILYFVWMLIYAPLWFHLDVKSILINFFVGFHHLWYIKALLLCGMLLYVMKKMKIKFLFLISFILFFLGSLIQFLKNIHILYFDVYSHRNFLFLGLPFFILGYLIRKTSWQTKISGKHNILFILIFTVTLLIESYLHYHFKFDRNDNLFSLILLCPLIFIYVINYQCYIKFNSKSISLISTSIYLLHPWVMHFLNMNYKINSVFLAIITISISFALSFVLIKINERIKYLL
ncbi:acyltransferase family protein [Polaribacter sargassicola]|uniref:acyltransferase family protein n=1 Tax=Polaribacter sargassicola TaxID=2836891 RepID=UPI001F225144|nr:acyltransferase [Polaribacter sp. DS7-9]MCG1035931.1 acyltransferase [Polaribacter sp. DS7-9]